VEQGGEERPVGVGELWFVDSALQDGELVAQPCSGLAAPARQSGQVDSAPSVQN